MSRDRCCILSKFYIKPQHGEGGIADITVVSYRNSTSNHNEPEPHLCLLYVVSYRNSTSNHNIWTFSIFGETVVSYRNSTSNHNLIGEHTTSPSLYLIEILHQTTTSRTNMSASTSCILSKFYIKPQRRPIKLRICRCCILSKFYIKPQLWL